MTQVATTQSNDLAEPPIPLVFTDSAAAKVADLIAEEGKNVDFQAVFEQFYKDEPFVDVMPAGSHPETRSVRGSNGLRIAIHRPGNGDTLVVLVVEDNLVKGASGQGVQCLNLMFGLPETLGLTQIALSP